MHHLAREMLIRMGRNHVDGDWFRQSVTCLVGGVVAEVGHQAHHKLQFDNPLDLDNEILEPASDINDGIDSTEQSMSTTASTTPRSANFTDYYALEPNGLVVHLRKCLSPHQQLADGWQAVTKHAAGPFSSAAVDECKTASDSLVQPSSIDKPHVPKTPDEKHGDDADTRARPHIAVEADSSGDSKLTELSPPPKRLRISSSSVASTKVQNGSPSGSTPGSEDGTRTPQLRPRVQERRSSGRAFWSRTDERLLIQLRNEGKDWDEIHQVRTT